MRIDEGREDEARQVLAWYLDAEASFDEQVDHFLVASILFEDLGDFASAFRCAREAWVRNVSRWESGRDGDSLPRRFRTDNPRVPRTLLLLAVNGLVAGIEDAAAWTDLAGEYPWGDKQNYPTGFFLLEAGRAYVQGDEEACREGLRRALTAPDARDILDMLRPSPAPAGRESKGGGKRKKRESKPRPVRNGGPRPYRDYLAVILGEESAGFDAFLSGSFAEDMRGEVERIAGGSPDDEAWRVAASLARASVVLGSVPTPEFLLLYARCCYETGEFREGIEVLDRAVAMKPAYEWKYRQLRGDCEKALRRGGSRR
jgi:hypothetical protein